MKFADRFISIARSVLPMPFTIAVLLTAVTFILALGLTSSDSDTPRVFELLGQWEAGMWKAPLLVFAFQMMLMLVLGHALALTPFFRKLIDKATVYCTNTATSAAIVTFLAIATGLINWGLGLIFGAILARKVAENAKRNNYDLNYPLIGASGYAGLMVWHGGFSGSAPIKVAEPDHFFIEEIGQIPWSETILSPMNLTVSAALLIGLPALMYWIGGRLQPHNEVELEEEQVETEEIQGAEKLDHNKGIAIALGSLVILFGFYKAWSYEGVFLGWLTPNFINYVLLGAGILLHGSFVSFIKAVDEAIGGAAGILIQFPLYFGIMGIMTSSGLVEVFSDVFVQLSNQTTYPLFTFSSAAIVNVFVPSGGGQWAVQGAVIIDAAEKLGSSIPKSIMAMAYGDQLTNMMQPFWALPLLGITGLKAKEILPYTLILMLAGILIFVSALLIF